MWEGELDWTWSNNDPAAALLGPWSAPTSLAQAMAQIKDVQELQRGRAAALARAWAIVGYHACWVRAGFDNQWDFARQVLGWSERTAQRRKALGWKLEWYPELDEAIRGWLDVGSAMHLASVIEDDAKQWIAVAKRVGRLELRRATEEAGPKGPRRTLQEYQAAIAATDSWAAEQESGGLPINDNSVPGQTVGQQAKGSSPAAPSAGGGSATPSAGGVLKVALPHRQTKTPQSPTLHKAPPELPEAARWFVEEVKLPVQRGFARVKERDYFQCQNPECGRITLRTEAHHIHWVSLGGSDDLENGITVCRACHLRGLHTGAHGSPPNIVVEPVVLANGVKALLWTYADGRQVMAFRSIPEPNVAAPHPPASPSYDP